MLPCLLLSVCLALSFVSQSCLCVLSVCSSLFPLSVMCSHVCLSPSWCQAYMSWYVCYSSHVHCVQFCSPCLVMWKCISPVFPCVSTFLIIPQCLYCLRFSPSFAKAPLHLPLCFHVPTFPGFLMFSQFRFS